MKLLPYEIWRDIPGYEGRYQASSMGDIKSVDRYIINSKGELKFIKGKILQPGLDKGGYYRVVLSGDGKLKTWLVHRLVAITFLENPLNYPEIDHINTVRIDNQISNIRWVTKQMNQANPITRQHLSGTNAPFYGKHHTEEVRRILSEHHKGIRYSAEINKKKGRPQKVGSENRLSKSVYQYTKEGIFIKEYPSCISAARDTGINQGAISSNCLHKAKSAGGFVWRYKNEEH